MCCEHHRECWIVPSAANLLFVLRLGLYVPFDTAFSRTFSKPDGLLGFIRAFCQIGLEKSGDFLRATIDTVGL